MIGIDLAELQCCRQSLRAANRAQIVQQRGNACIVGDGPAFGEIHVQTHRDVVPGVGVKRLID